MNTKTASRVAVTVLATLVMLALPFLSYANDATTRTPSRKSPNVMTELPDNPSKVTRRTCGTPGGFNPNKETLCSDCSQKLFTADIGRCHRDGCTFGTSSGGKILCSKCAQELNCCEGCGISMKIKRKPRGQR